MDDQVRLKNHKNKFSEEESNRLSPNDAHNLNKLFKSTSTQTESINIWDFINFPAKFPFVVWPFLVPPPPQEPEQKQMILDNNQQLNKNHVINSNEYDVANDNWNDEALDDSEDEDEEEINLECDAIEYEEIILKRSSVSQSFGIYVSNSCPKGYNQATESSSSPSSKMMTTRSDKDSVYIDRVDSKVAKCSTIKNGDQILKINNMEAKNKDLVNLILNKSEGLELRLLIGRANLNHDHRKCKDRFVAKRLQALSWCSSDQSSDYNDHEYAEIIYQEQLGDQQLEVNKINYGQMTKEDKVDSGLGKTDNESLSTDNDITPLVKANPSGSRLSTYQPDLSQNDMISHNVEKIQKQFENLSKHCDDNRTIGVKQGPTLPARTVTLNQSKRSSLILPLSANSWNLRSSQVVTVGPKVAPKVSPKVKSMFEKPKSVPSKTESSKLSHALQEMQSFEKKESIRNWIKNGVASQQSTNHETQQLKPSIAPIMLPVNKNRKPNGHESKSDSNLVSYTYNPSNDCVNNSTTNQVHRLESEALNHEHASGSKSNDQFFYTTMYTTKANLEQTILLQQQLLRQAILEKQLNASKNGSLADPKAITCNRSCLPNQAANHDDQSNSKVNLEWKVKKRADGSRYIVRKSNRKKILKQREQQLIQERCGMTTDDDAMSEMKVSKGWIKDEGRRCVQHKSAEKQQKGTQMRGARMEAARDQSDKLKKEESDNLVNTVFNSKSNQNVNFSSNLKLTKQSQFVQKQLYNPHSTSTKRDSNDLLAVTIV